MTGGGTASRLSFWVPALGGKRDVIAWRHGYAPGRAQAAARMPALGLTKEEALALANYLVSLE